MRIDRIKLITEMAKRNMKLSTLAEKTGLHITTIGNIRRGISCRYETALVIAHTLEVDVNELLEQEG